MYNLEKYSKSLELNKVLELLSQQASCDDSKAMALELRPTGNYYQTIALMEKTADAYSLSMSFGSPSIHAFKNCNECLMRAQKGAKLSLRELLSVADVLRNVRGFWEWRRRCESRHTALDDLFNLLAPNKPLEELITSSILSEEEMADTASDELCDIRRKIRSAQQKIREKLDKLVKSPTNQKFLQESIITLRDGRFVVPVKSEYRNEIKGLVHDTSASGATFFVEPLAVVESNNEIRILQSREQQEIERIIAALSAQVGTNCHSIMDSYKTVVELDLYFAKAALAHKMKATVPTITEDSCVELNKARHPLIDPAQVVPTTLRIGKDFDILVITGPNTGGKTVALKTLGLLCMMAMVGLMLPVQEGSSISVFEKVLVDIGDEQSIEQSLSTFSAHMTNIVSIIENTNPHCLVLIDELGAGTDPVEGAALAVSIIERLSALGAKVAATTHYAEIKMYALTTPRVLNASCEFDVATLRPTYKLLMGIPGKSNAFAISKRLGLSDDIIEQAKNHISTENARFEDVVSQLEDTRQQLEVEKERAVSLKDRERKARMEFNTYKQKMEHQMDKELESAQNQARGIVERAKAQAQELLDELTDLRRQKENEKFSQMVTDAKGSFKTAVNKLDIIANPVIDRRQDDYVLPRPLQKGDRVLITDLNDQGIVISPADNAGNVMVQAGIMKTKVQQSTLRLLDNKKATAPTKGNVTQSIKSKAEREVKSEIDLRGTTVEEALVDIDQYIDNCVLSGVTTITIIHGKGTGALRAAIHQHLRKHRNIRTYRLGVFGEGEAGVTIAELK